MKVVLTCGPSNALLARTHAVLGKSGVAAARPARQPLATPLLLQAAMIDAASGEGAVTGEVVVSGAIWSSLAADMLLANGDHDAWGWSDGSTLHLLEFWREFDPRVCFVLVWSRLEDFLIASIGERTVGEAELEQSIGTWVDAHRRILRFHHENPQRCVLVNDQDSVLRPGLLVDHVAQRFGLDLSFSSSTPDDTGRFLDLKRAVVRELSHGRPAVMELHDELHASSTLTGTPSSTASSLAAWSELNALLERRSSREAAALPAASNAEMSLLLLHQIQEELEHYYLAWRALHRRTDHSLHKAFWRSHLREIRIDLRDPVNGDNWHEAEADGRWTGAGLESSLLVPALGPGRYSVRIHVVDAMRDDLLDAARLDVNGTPVALRREMAGYPTCLIGVVDLAERDDEREWRLVLKFPETMSPAERGERDARRMAARVRSVALVLLDSDQPVT